MRFRGSLTLAIIVALAGCQLGQPTGVKTPKPVRKGASPEASAAPGGLKVEYAPLVETRRPIDASDLTAKTKLVAVELTGKAKLISDHGAGIISNNTGGLISDHGSGLVSNNSGSLISNNSGSLTAKAKYVLAQAAAAESFLADASIELLDGAGHVLVGPDGAPLGVRTDAQGAFRFQGQLPDENLVLRIRLFNGGQLLALVPRAAAGGPRTVDLDTAASLGAAFVLETFVQKRPDVFAKLPAAEAEALRAEIESARAFLPADARTYKLTDLVAATQALSEQAQPVAARLEKIKALLVAGQANLGEGRPAREVSLSTPAGLAGLPDGTLLVAESSAGRLRRITTDLRAGLYLGSGLFFTGGKLVEARGEFFESPGSIKAFASGELVFTDTVANRVRKVGLDGRVTTLLGTGARVQGAVGGAGTATSLVGPRGLAVGPDGSLYVGEVTKMESARGRIIRVRPDGTTEAIATPVAGWGRGEIAALAVGPDGTIWAGEGYSGVIQKRAPDGTWTVLDAEAGIGDFSDFALTADGELLASGYDGHRVWRYARSGERTLVAGSGTAGYAGDGGPATAAALNRPSGIWPAPDGRIVFVDGGNGVVREVRRDGTIATLAGAVASDVVGDATSIAINSPSGVAIDADGRLLIAEAAGDTIKRLENGRLVKIAGAGKGFEGDGGPALAARFNTLGGIAVSGKEIYLVDTVNEKLRKIDAAGVVSTVAGALDGSNRSSRRIPARMLSMGRPLAVAVGPEGLPYWSDNQENKVYRLAADGMVEVVAGNVDGTPGDAPDAPGPAVGGGLANPVGLAFDAAGDLYVCDSANLKIRKVTGLASGDPVMSTYAGTGFAGALDLFAGKRPEDEGKPKEEAVLIGPATITFGPDGACYVGEAGSLKLATLGGITGMDVSQMPRITSRIRRIGKDGTIRTIAGPGSSLLADPGSDDTIITPLGLVFDREGRLIVADGGTNQVKLIPKGAF